MKPFLVILWVVLHGGALWWNAVAGMPAYGMLERDESDAVWSAPDMDALQPVAAVMGQRELTPKPSPVYTAAGIDEPSPRPFYPASWWGPIAFHGGLSPRYFADEFGPRTPTQGGVAKRGIPNRQIRAILFHDYDDEDGRGGVQGTALSEPEKRFNRLAWLRERKAASPAHFVQSADGGGGGGGGGAFPHSIGVGKLGGKAKGAPALLFNMRMFG